MIASTGEEEGTPNAVVEAQSCGLPVVCTRHGGIVDLVAEGQSGYLVDEHDVHGMAECMKRLAVDGSLAARMGAAGRECVMNGFTLTQSIEKMSGLIQGAFRSGVGRN